MFKEYGHWIDESDNSWNAKKYTKEQSIKYSETLVDCKYCIDCIDCEDCTNCINCKNCTYCTACIHQHRQESEGE